MSAEDLIERLGLEPHPEGGYFREMFRSAATVQPADGRGERSALTAIYFLLAAGQFSRWHRVRSDETWQFCEGDPLELLIFDASASRVERRRIGPAGDGNDRPSVVPAGRWQAARTRGAYTLLTCIVAPGFDYADLEFLTDAPDDYWLLEAAAPDLTSLAGGQERR